MDDDDEAWPRFDLPEPVADYQRGKISWEEMIRYMEEVMALIEALE